jgi:hypothetical protein
VEVLLNSWALKLLPGNKTGAQLTLDKPIRQNFLTFNVWEGACPRWRRVSLQMCF